MMKPELHLRGVVTSIDRTLVQSGCKNRLKQSLSDRWTDFARLEWGQVEVDWVDCKCSWSANYNEEYVVNCTANHLLC